MDIETVITNQVEGSNASDESTPVGACGCTQDCDHKQIEDLQIELIDCDNKVESGELDELVSSVNIQHKTKYLQALTRNLDNNFKGYYVLAKLRGEVVAWTYVFIDAEFALHGVLTGFLEKIYNIFPVKFRAAFISSPVAEYNMIHIKDRFKHLEKHIAEKIMTGLQKFLKKEKIELVIIKDHINKYTSDFFHKKFIHVHFMPGSFIDLEDACVCKHVCVTKCECGCSCFDSYLVGLKKKRKANIRYKMKRRKEELVIEIVDAGSLTKEECGRCHELYTQTRNKQRLKHENLAPGYFYDCARELGDACKIMLAKVEDKIIGFAQLLENAEDVINVRMGMDYEYNKEYNLYYHLLYENIIYSLRKKKKRLYTSQSSYRPKLEMGAKLFPLHTYFCFSNPFLQKIFGKLIASNCQCYTDLITAENPSEVAKKHKLCPY